MLGSDDERLFEIRDPGFADNGEMTRSTYVPVVRVPALRTFYVRSVLVLYDPSERDDHHRHHHQSITLPGIIKPKPDQALKRTKDTL